MRWRRVALEIPAWDERNRIIAALIPTGSSVLELGSGAQTLRRYLKEDCEYQPCDVVATSSEVLLCDFNRGIYPKVSRSYDYVICSGLLEYVQDLSQFFSVAACLGREMVVSYAPERKGRTRMGRRLLGWVNSFTRPQLEALLSALGLQWEVAGTWRDQIIYRVQRGTPRDANRSASIR